MMSARLVLVLAAAASAQQQQPPHMQYAITDLISHDQSMPTSQPGLAAPVASPPVATPGAIAPTPASVGNGLNSVLGGPAPTAPAAGSATFGSGAPPMNGGNAMASLLSVVTKNAANSPALQSQSTGPLSGKALSQESMAVVSGLVEAFMHKVNLLPGERACLENNMGSLAGDVMGTVGDIVTAIKDLVAGQGTVQKKATGGIVSAGIDSAMKITSLITLSTSVLKDCVHGDALALMKTCASHMVNATYLEHRFIVNGVDIAHSLSDSIIAFEAHDLHRFGTDIGISLRKLVLSNATNGTRLPEGVPEEVIIQKATDGLMKGFFESGSSMEITDTAHPDIDIKVNLHQCIAGNSAFFKELWMAAWDLIAQLSVNANQHGIVGRALQPLGQSQQGGQPKWTGELMVAMMQFPMALERCGVSQDMQDTFMEAIRTLNDVQVHFQFPGDAQTAVTDQGTMVTEKMAKAVEAWTNWDFEGFGVELGELFRELVMLAFPQKYSIDANGRLRLYGQALIEGKKAGAISGSMMIIGGAAVSLLVALVAMRTRRSMLHAAAPIVDIEGGDASDELVE